ncbi:hypothetical protein BGZ46_002224 [Entomortierella lignicola]|nr:hypothetical protein BGZ46_002224 [Entomortierella lignicola]
MDSISVSGSVMPQDQNSRVQGDHHRASSTYSNGSFKLSGPGRISRHARHSSLGSLTSMSHSGLFQAQTTQIPSKFTGANNVSGAQLHHGSFVQPSPPQSVTPSHPHSLSHQQFFHPPQAQTSPPVQHSDSFHSLHQQQQAHLLRLHQQQPSMQEHHHHHQLQYATQPISQHLHQSQQHPNIHQRQGAQQNGSSNGKLIRTHTHSLSHSHIHMLPYQQQIQSQHYAEFEPYPGQQQQQQQHSGMSHSISMPVKPLAVHSGMHNQFGGQSQGHHEYQHQDTTMDSDASSDAGSGDEGVRWTRQENNDGREEE